MQISLQMRRLHASLANSKLTRMGQGMMDSHHGMQFHKNSERRGRDCVMRRSRSRKIRHFSCLTSDHVRSQSDRFVLRHIHNAETTVRSTSCACSRNEMTYTKRPGQRIRLFPILLYHRSKTRSDPLSLEAENITLKRNPILCLESGRKGFKTEKLLEIGRDERMGIFEGEGGRAEESHAGWLAGHGRASNETSGRDQRSRRAKRIKIDANCEPSSLVFRAKVGQAWGI